MSTTQAICDAMFTWAPKDLAASWDSVGFQLGSKTQAVRKVLLSLDVDELALERIKKGDIDLLLTHHPIFFSPLSQLDIDTDMGRIVAELLKTQTSLLSFHTNLDAAQNGVNDTLVEYLGFSANQGCALSGHFGKQFDVSGLTLAELSARVPCDIRGDTRPKDIKKIAFCCGSAHGLIKAAVKAKCDVLVTGEITYHDHITCAMNGISVLCLGHWESEVIVLPKIKAYLLSHFPHLIIEVLN
jgi:GTP cyclohydrolase I